jgi:hypothetical protein
MSEYTAINQAHSLVEVSNAGKQLTLDDGSCWDVYAGFAERAMLWVAGEMVNVRPFKDEQYPYRLINVHRNESVDAKLISC